MVHVAFECDFINSNFSSVVIRDCNLGFTETIKLSNMFFFQKQKKRFVASYKYGFWF